MAVIGKFTQSGPDFTGTINTLTLKGKCLIQAIVRPGTPEAEHVGETEDKKPNYKVLIEKVEVGAGWFRTSADQQTQYISVTIDDPSLPGAINATLFPREGGGADLVWNRK